MISVEHVVKSYGGVRAVDDVSFQCEPGTVTGFLGPNGAGKSTTLRIIAGLTRPTSGAVTVQGVPYRQLPDPGTEVGVLLDASAQHAGRSGHETLAICAATIGVSESRIPALLKLVGLPGPAARKRVGTYSLGMRQRLGIAQALLGDPRVLVLDEPANGLDREGIFWLRGLLRGFADRGGTVLLSSHLLRVVEAVADHLVVIGGGRIVADGTKDDLLRSTGVAVRALEPEPLIGALRRAGRPVTRRRDGSFLVDAGPVPVGRAAAAVLAGSAARMGAAR